MYAELQFKSVDIYKNIQYSNINKTINIQQTTLQQFKSFFDDSTHVTNFKYKRDELKKVIIPNNKETYDDSLFENCYNLEEVKLSKNTKIISKNMFDSCFALKAIIIPDSTYEISSFAFLNCKSLHHITIPDNISSIGICAFAMCTNLKSITYKGVTYTNKEDFNIMAEHQGLVLYKNITEYIWT